MINPVGSSSTVVPVAHQAPSQRTASKPEQVPQDTVHLSPAALKAAGGDMDHDGDSH